MKKSQHIAKYVIVMDAQGIKRKEHINADKCFYSLLPIMALNFFTEIYLDNESNI